MKRFVILEHTWDGVHWDLMLESGDALRTWAIDTVPEPGRDLAAKALPDHRRAYLEYEGPISRNRGTVRRIEEGRYELLVWNTDRVVVRLVGKTLRGVLTLVADSASDPSGAWLARIDREGTGSRS